MQSLRSSQPCFASFQAGKRSEHKTLKTIGARIAKLLTVICLVSLGGCATTTPVTNTTGAVESLIRDENYSAVRTADPKVRAWAKRALHYVNDL
ncbi:MAG: hypothetical protein EBT07_16645, partial [Actinobacteria bacterium]|nr:hypothetical protein [Actinomycetota bacterium]